MNTIKYMKTSQEIEQLVMQVVRLVEADKKTEIRLNANGGNSVLLVCPPQQEKDFIEVLQRMIDKNIFNIVDLNELLTGYIEKQKSHLEERFSLLQSSLHQIFKAQESESDAQDFYNFILENIRKSFAENKIPVLVNTGALYGTGIESIHFMENKLVMNSKFPIVILYPGEETKDKLMFLNSRPASKYRCLIIK